ncbi:MAG: DUF5009 domain-containing protein [Breznakibacter sp.]
MPSPQSSPRLRSLDALRGFTVAGMILVNSPGSWSYVYAPFRHADFNGLTLADLVFPFFLFIVGASAVLALGKRLQAGDTRKSLVTKIAKRAILIFALGVFLNWLSSGFSEWRIAGVLQRIAICYWGVSWLFLYVRRRWQMAIGAIILTGYAVWCMVVPIPGHGVVFNPQVNWPAWVDSRLLPGKMYFGHWDPEGILGTFPALVTALMGMWATGLVCGALTIRQKIARLSLYGVALTIVGYLLSWWFPLNKNVWSSSFVLVTAGLASLLWSLAIFLIDHRQRVRWAFVGLVFGANAITAYVLHFLLAYPLARITVAGQSVQTCFMAVEGEVLAPELASLLWAVLYTALCFIPVYLMYRKNVFVKI